MVTLVSQAVDSLANVRVLVAGLAAALALRIVRVCVDLARIGVFPGLRLVDFHPRLAPLDRYNFAPLRTQRLMAGRASPRANVALYS